jgi:Putative Ig domain
MIRRYAAKLLIVGFACLSMIGMSAGQGTPDKAGKFTQGQLEQLKEVFKNQLKEELDARFQKFENEFDERHPGLAAGAKVADKTLAKGKGFAAPKAVKLKNGEINVVRFGRNPSKFNAPRSFKLSKYTLKLPALPARMDYGTKSSKSLKDSYLNAGQRPYGDCVIAAGWHIRGVVTGQTGTGQTRNEVIATEDQIKADYAAIAGWDESLDNFQPNGKNLNPTDKGTDLMSAMTYWTKNGFGGTGRGNLLGFIRVNPAKKEELKTALFLFENLYFGFRVPDQWPELVNADGFIWDFVGQPNFDSGHCVMGYGYTDEGILINTWGFKGTCTYDAIKQYMSANFEGECYVLVSSEQIARGEKNAPNGLDWAQLRKDFVDLGGQDFPIPSDNGGGAPTITSRLSASGTPGVAFSYPITATNAPTSFAADGLPAGLSIDGTTGLISGIPSSAASSSVTLGATNATGTGKATLMLSIGVTPCPAPPANYSATVQDRINFWAPTPFAFPPK